jgi:hypothetical protein
VVNEKVELRRATEDLSTSIVDLSIIRIRLGRRGKSPVAQRVGVEKTGTATTCNTARSRSEDGLGDLEERSSFDNGDAESSLGQSVSDGVSSRSSSHNDIVVGGIYARNTPEGSELTDLDSITSESRLNNGLQRIKECANERNVTRRDKRRKSDSQERSATHGE